MVVTELVQINGIPYKKTYSTEGFKIQRNMIKYNEAIDPISTLRVYEETDEKIEEELNFTGQ